MHFFIISSFLTMLLCQTVQGVDISSLLRSGASNATNIGVGMLSKPLLDYDSDILNNNSYYGQNFKNITEGYRLDADDMNLSTINGGALQSELSNLATENNNQSQNIEHSTDEFKSGFSTNITTEKTAGNTMNESSPINQQAHSSSESPKATATTIASSTKSNQTSPQPDDAEPEKVVLGKPSNGTIFTSPPKTVYQKTLELFNDTYTLSVLLPITAGVVFAATIIVFIATCRCVKRQCRRRRLRKKTLPDSVKNLRPSDRARLLAESSDEEF